MIEMCLKLTVTKKYVDFVTNKEKMISEHKIIVRDLIGKNYLNFL